MAERLDGTVALVTGASSGIGEATARTLAKQGAAVALVARRAERLEQLAEDIMRDGAHSLVLATDVTDKTQAQAAVARTVAALGRLDIVVNNAGVGLLGPIENAPLDEWEQMVRVNVLGVLYVAHAALPYLLQAAQNGPRQVADLVTVSSVAGRVARSGDGVYSLTKFGEVAFSESLRQEVTRRHVRVAVVEPGVVATEILGHVRDEVRQQEQFKQTFSGFEPLAAEDIAEAIGYIVTRPRRVAINELLIRPTEQE
jgi:NADP-dependent 3-hydroxy acid dehydrogenase YdfG